MGNLINYARSLKDMQSLDATQAPETHSEAMPKDPQEVKNALPPIFAFSTKGRDLDKSNNLTIDELEEWRVKRTLNL